MKDINYPLKCFLKSKKSGKNLLVLASNFSLDPLAFKG